MTLNTYVAGNPGEARSYAQELRKLGRGTETAATGAHQARTTAEGEWDGAASDAFQGWAKTQGTDGDALAEVYPTVARAHDALAEELDTVQARMEQAKQVARDGGLKLMGAHLILPPKAPTGSQPEPPKGRATAAQMQQYSADKAAYDAAMAEMQRQQAAWQEAKATVHAAREKERTAHQSFSDAMDKIKGQLKDIGQAQKWAHAGVQPASAAAASLATAATTMESSSAAATKSMLENSIGNPAAVNAAWSSMSTAQRADLIDRFPQMVGSTNGVPAVARDQANRSILAAQRQAIVNKIDGLQKAMKEDFRKHGHSDNAKGHDIHTLQQALDGIDQLQDKLGASADKSGYYLLGLDSTANDRGQAIIAQGNPDYADNTMTLTPGTYSDLQDVTKYVGDNENILERANQMAPDKNNVAITWASYESPNHLFPHAATSGYADEAAPDLSEFQEGLRATHEGDNPSNNTLVGHSYGSTVVGETSHSTEGSYSDNIVFLGSPGTGVDTVGPLDVPRDHVWAGKAGNDIIDITPATPGGAIPGSEDVRAGLPMPGYVDVTARWAATLTGVSDYAAFGLDPTDPQFGAQNLPTAPDGEHGDYWQQSQSRDAMARIMTGNQGGS